MDVKNLFFSRSFKAKVEVMSEKN